MKEIVLTVPKEYTTNLYGKELGLEIYENQLKNNIDLKSGTKPIFPKEIKRLSSSFIQALAKNIANEIGYTELPKRIHISDPNLEKQFFNNLF